MVKTAAIRNFARPKARFAFAQNSALAFEIVFNWGFAKRSRNRRSFARVAFANSRSFDRFAMNRGQNCGYLQSRLWARVHSKAPDIPACMVVCIKRKPAQWRASKRRSGWRGEVGRPRGCALGQRLSSRRSAQSSSDALGPKLDAVPRADPWTEGLPSRLSGCNCRGCRRSVRRFSRPNRTPCTPW